MMSLPLALGTTLVIGLYVLANFAYLAALPLRADETKVLEATARLLTTEKSAADKLGDIKHLELSKANAQISKLQGEREGRQSEIEALEAQRRQPE